MSNSSNGAKWRGILSFLTRKLDKKYKKGENSSFFVQTGVVCLILNVVCLAAGFFIARLLALAHSQRITIAIEVGLQNGTLALLVSGTILGNSIMTIPAVTYSLLMFVTGAVFCFLVNLSAARTANQE